MQVNVAGLRRAAKNIAHNYTDPQKKVREATSNDPWGPSSTIMSEIADLTYNIEAFAQIMEMLWKRLNDSGKNWRHVYKSLVLLEYLIKTGSERVGQQCKENIFAIQTLKDFQHLEDNKDQGLNVREKAKQLVALLTSEERLRTERTRALKARERFAQTLNAFGSSDSNEASPTSPVIHSHGFNHGVHSNGHSSSSRIPRNPELESARPQTQGEEELQLQLALAMSKEEAEEEEKRRRNDDLRLQMALSQSEQEFKTMPAAAPPKKKENTSAILDLLDVDLGGAAALPLTGTGNNLGGGDPWGMHQNSQPVRANQTLMQADAWNISAPSSTINSPQDAWSVPPRNTASSVDPWMVKPNPVVDPWAPASAKANAPFAPEEDEFDVLSKRVGGRTSETSFDPHMGTLLTPTGPNRSNNTSPTQAFAKKTPSQFLGENSSLVDLDNLLHKSASTTPVFGNSVTPLTSNPFESNTGLSLLSTSAGATSQTVNPFHIQNNILKPSINEIREKQQMQHIHSGQSLGVQQPQNNPWSPV
jgi:epsin